LTREREKRMSLSVSTYIFSVFFLSLSRSFYLYFVPGQTKKEEFFIFVVCIANSTNKKIKEKKRERK
jgi:hypothetical protein